MQRAMFLEFLDDRTTHYLDRQFMLGPALLVAPVFVPEGEESEYYLPEGRWTSFFQPTRTQTGPVWVKEVVPIDQIPVWVRQGSVLCLGPAGIGRPDYEFGKAGLEVQAYELEMGKVYTKIPAGKGKEAAGVVRVFLERGNLEVFVSEGNVSLTSVSYFTGGQVKKSETKAGAKGDDIFLLSV